MLTNSWMIQHIPRKIAVQSHANTKVLPGNPILQSCSSPGLSRILVQDNSFTTSTSFFARLATPTFFFWTMLFITPEEKILWPEIRLNCRFKSRNFLLYPYKAFSSLNLCSSFRFIYFFFIRVIVMYFRIFRYLNFCRAALMKLCRHKRFYIPQPFIVFYEDLLDSSRDCYFYLFMFS